MPKVSVIVPNYNHGRFLAQRLDSVLAQTYTDFEVIYLDDRSTDNSAEVFEAYAKNPRIQCVVNATNSGNPFVQWNRGVARASGEYVWVAEADDYAAPEFLEKLTSVLDAHPKAALAFCQSQFVDEEGRATGNSADWCPRLASDFVSSGSELCLDVLLFRNIIGNASSVLFRRARYLEVGGADEHYRVSGDWITWIRMLWGAESAYCAAPMNFWRRYRKSVSGNDTALAIRAQEYYRLLLDVQALELSDAIVTRARRAAVRQWVDAAVAAFPAISRACPQEMRQLARQADPTLTLRLAGAVPYFLRKLIVRRLLGASSLPTAS